MPNSELRKKIKAVEARISKLASERIKLNTELEKIEKACIHNWSQPTLVRGNQYERECAICGKVQKAKDVKVQF